MIQYRAIVTMEYDYANRKPHLSFQMVPFNDIE